MHFWFSLLLRYSEILKFCRGQDLSFWHDVSFLRSNPVARCASAAHATGTQSMFALQRYGQCHSVNMRKLARHYEEIKENCSRKTLGDGSYEVFQITSVNATSQVTSQTVVDGEMFKSRSTASNAVSVWWFRCL